MLGVIAILPFAILLAGSVLAGLLLDVGSLAYDHATTEILLLLVFLLAMVPGVYGAGVGHQVTGWSRLSRTGIVGLVAMLGAVAAAFLAGLTGAGWEHIVLDAVVGAGLGVLLTGPGLALLFPSLERSYGRLSVGVVALVLGLAWLTVAVRTVLTEAAFWVGMASAAMSLQGMLLGSAWLGEGWGFGPGDRDTPGDSPEQEPARVNGEVAETGRATLVSERLARHGWILVAHGAVFAALAVVGWTSGLVTFRPNEATTRGLALGWLGSLTVGLAVSLLLLGVVSVGWASTPATERPDEDNTAHEDKGGRSEEEQTPR